MFYLLIYDFSKCYPCPKNMRILGPECCKAYYDNCECTCRVYIRDKADSIVIVPSNDSNLRSGGNMAATTTSQTDDVLTFTIFLIIVLVLV